MRWSAGIIVCLIFLSTNVLAQRSNYGVVKGLLVDSSEDRPLESASIAVYLASDSSLVNYTLTDSKGGFTIAGIQFNTKCNLVISIKGYDDLYLSFTVSAANKEKQFDTIRLMKSYNELKAVTITAAQPPVAVRQDTLEFNVSSFKTMPNAMLEELLKQLPGVEIDKDGNITVNGKKVSKVMIDGREFFGGDPKIAIKSLPKEIIDKLQVVDNKSRESRFNKITNGNEDLAINLTLKKEAQKGWIGRASAGYGSSERYEGSAMLNFFDGSRQLNLIANTNNTNREPISGGDFNISNNSSTLDDGGSGLNHTSSSGVNFSSDLGRQLKLNGSYIYNNSHSDNFSKVWRENRLPDTTFLYNADNTNGNNYINHRLSLNAQYNIDTLTELHVNSYLINNVSDGNAVNKAASTSPTRQLINTSENTYNTNADAKYIISEFFLSHRFKKPARGITMGLNYNYNVISSFNRNMGRNDYYKGSSLDSIDLVNQTSVGESRNRFLSLTATYAEPINKYFTALLMYTYIWNTNLSDKITNRFNNSTGKYDIEDSAYTSAFRNATEVHNPDVALSLNRNKYYAFVSSGLQLLQQQNVTVSTGTLLRRYYVNFTPSINFRYNFREAASASVLYEGSTQQPTILQLQPVKDNSNPLNVQAGNPNLRPSFFHRITVQVRKSEGSNYWFSSMNFNITENQIVDETWFDDVGKQVSQPININGNYGISSNLQYSRTWKTRNVTLRMNLGSNEYFNRNNSFVNKVQVASNGYSISPSIGWNFTYKQFLNVMTYINIRYNKTHYSSESMQDAHFNTKKFSVSAFWNHPKRLIIENNLLYNYNSQLAPGFSKNVTMWSAALNYLLFKRQEGMLRLAIYDILKQNAGIYRSITQNYVEDRQTQVLQRYFLLSIIYNLKKRGSK